MKIASIPKLGLLALSFSFAIISDNQAENAGKFTNDSLISCYWVTYCGDPDNYTPILQPKDNKTETQDTKDKKLA